MKIGDLKDMIAGLQDRANDAEDAHAYEDTIREAVLWAISQGTAEDAKRLAELALSTSAIVFPRRCA